MIVTVLPATGVELLDVTRYCVAVPAPTVLVKGLPLMSVVFMVITTLSGPATVGV